MKVKYLLPCSCGIQIPVEMSQSGLTTTCSCGAQLHIPSRGKIAQLPLAESEGATQGRTKGSSGAWGLRQQLQFVGTLILAGGLVYMGYTYANYPSAPKVNQKNIDDVRSQVDRMNLWESYQFLKYIVSTGPGVDDPNSEYGIYAQRVDYSDTHLIFGGVVCGIGILFGLSGFLFVSVPPKKS